MGRMKDFLMEVLDANDGIPQGMTLSDVVKMKELQIFEWQEYERRKKQEELQQYQSQNPGETAKIEQVKRKFSGKYGQSIEKKSE